MKKPAKTVPARISMLRLGLLLCAGLTPLALGCNPYNPDLGSEPFRCGTDEPRCPDGYKCDERSEIEHVCVLESTVIPDRPDAMILPPDALQFTCNNDQALEPNNSITQPTITPIPELRDDYAIGNLAICPTTDVDIFRFRIDQTGKSIRVDLMFSAAKGGLLLDILNSSGVSIEAGIAVEGDPNLVRAVQGNVAADIYYARVRATPGVENNYSLHIITINP
jgi:hypothetical protein